MSKRKSRYVFTADKKETEFIDSIITFQILHKFPFSSCLSDSFIWTLTFARRRKISIWSLVVIENFNLKSKWLAKLSCSLKSLKLNTVVITYFELSIISFSFTYFFHLEKGLCSEICKSVVFCFYEIFSAKMSLWQSWDKGFRIPCLRYLSGKLFMRKIECLTGRVKSSG